MELLRTAPQESLFTPVADYQAQTPETFDSSTPVLYHKSKGKLLVLKEEAPRHPIIEILVKDSGSTTEDESWLVHEIEAWISSEKLILWHPSSSVGVGIPYPAISLHALGSIPKPGTPDEKIQALYLEITVIGGSNNDDDDGQEGSIALNLIPESTTTMSSSAGDSETSLAQQIFDAVTECANLHPDPASPSSSQADGGGYGVYGGEENEGEEAEDGPVYDYEVLEGNRMPAPFPGSSGWITAENVNQYFDEDGNWRAGGLGPGAGIVRERQEDDDGVGEPGVNGTHATDGDDETKWRRTS